VTRSKKRRPWRPGPRAALAASLGNLIFTLVTRVHAAESAPRRWVAVEPEHRPGHSAASLAVGRPPRGEPERFTPVVPATWGVPLSSDDATSTRRTLQDLAPLPLSGPAARVSLGVGRDGRSGAASGPVAPAGSAGSESSLVDVDVVVRTSPRSSLGVAYSGDLLESLEPELESFGVRAHQVTSRLEWVPSSRVRVRWAAGGTRALTGVDTNPSLQWDRLLALRADMVTGLRSWARLELSEQSIGATGASYLDGRRVDLVAAHAWRWSELSVSLWSALRSRDAGVQQLTVAPSAYAECAPSCDRRSYLAPQSYWSPGGGAGVDWQLARPLSLSTQGRAEYRGYHGESGIPDVVASQAAREDWRLRARARAELRLDHSGRFRLSLSQTMQVSLSNVPVAETLAEPNTELGISAQLP
jgi:hypothetical protein